jgi:hypothetical protein
MGFLGERKAMKQLAIVAAMLAATFLAPMSQAQKKKLSVQIVNRQTNQSEYTYTVWGYSQTNCSVYVTGKYGSGSCTKTGAPGRSERYIVSGATFSLLLPDGQLAVVNCNPKFSWTVGSNTNAHGGCRQPIEDTIEAEFDGNNAILEWPVSIDGKKKQTVRYKIIGILSKIPT